MFFYFYFYDNFRNKKVQAIKRKTLPRKAFTITELVFVIVIIGILSAIAVPKFKNTMEIARDSKGASVLSSVMSALSTERQKRILKGDFTGITSLGSGTYAFSTFSADRDGNTNDVVSPYISSCTNPGCWARSGISYKYYFADAAEGTADFKLDKNKLVCDSDDADCSKLLKFF